MKTRDVLAVFNRGRISRLALARTDVARVALSAEVQKNWVPRALGSMMVRPGMEYLGRFLGDGVYIPFVFSNDDCALLEMTAGVMRVWEDGTDILTRPAVTATVANGFFTTNLTSWTSADEVGAASTWDAAGYMRLLGTGYATAKRQQEVTVIEPGIVHALRIVITRGPVVLRIGTTAGADDVFRQAVLRTGMHSISFTPSANFFIEFSSSVKWPVLVNQCTVEAAGILELPTPWVTADQCRSIRWAQSFDVLFCAATGLRQRRIERRGDGSWSVVSYQANDGPFLTENVENILLTASALTGEATITSTRPIFEAGHVGALWRLSSQGQKVESPLSADLTFTNAIRVTGVEAGRIFTVSRTDVWAGTLSLQRSLGEPGTWITVATYTTTGSVSYDDGLDNSIAYYRLGFEAGGYTSGTVTATLEYPSGSITGTVRIIEVTNETTVNSVVLKDLGSTAATEIWSEGAWSDVRGWPDAVSLAEGRLWWHGNGSNWGSVPDGFFSFDPDTIGDSQPISRRIGEGAVARANWALPLQNLIVGTDAAEHSIRSTSFEEPVTPANYNVRSRTTKGSSQVPAVMADGRGYFVGRTETQVFELEYDPGSYGYVASDAMALVPEVGDPGVVRLAIQQSPDTRLHAVRLDGTVAMMVRDTAEDVKAWIDIETDGQVVDATVLPGIGEDRVFYLVRRTIGGVDYYHHELIAQEGAARGGDENTMADSFKTGSGAMVGLGHLEGKTVILWGDGEDRGVATVVGGAVAGSYDSWCIGLGYEAVYRSAKLAGQTALGLSLTQRSRVNAIGLVMADTHAQGVQYGPDLDALDDMPLTENGLDVAAQSIWNAYDSDMIEFPGEWSTDNRVCLRGIAPRPCTILATVLNIDRQDAS